MGAATGLRNDLDAASLRGLARTTKCANQGRRLLALAEVYDGGKRGDAARIAGVGLQIVRDWGVRFNARGFADLLDGKARGKPLLLNEAQRQALAEIVASVTISAIHRVVRWRLSDLTRWLHDEFGISLTETTVGRELKKLDSRESDRFAININDQTLIREVSSRGYATHKQPKGLAPS
jgi:transposase